MSPDEQDDSVIFLDKLRKQKKNTLTDRDRIIFAHHYIQQSNQDEGLKLLSQVSQQYYVTQLHRDLARALLCYLTVKTTGNDQHFKESEFYLIVYSLTKRIVSQKLIFQKSGYFMELKDTLFKDFNL